MHSIWDMIADAYDGHEEAPTEPEPEIRVACPHLKVFAAKNEGPYPWICAQCSECGEDAAYPVCDSNLYLELLRKKNGEIEPEGPGKTRCCYYCGKLVIGHSPDNEPVRCGKCI